MGRYRDRLNVASVNAHSPAGRAEDFAAWLADFVAEHDTHVVSLQETSPSYRRKILDRLDFDLFYNWQGAFTGLLVRQDVHWSKRERIEHDYTWYGWKTDRTHPPRTDVALDLDGWLTLATVHAPPSVDVTDTGLVGPRDRVRAYRNYYYNLKEFGREQRRDPNGLNLAYVGDFNEGKRSTGRYSPAWLARQTSTAVYGVGIDLVVTDATVRDYTRRSPGPGMDHLPRTFTLLERQ